MDKKSQFYIRFPIKYIWYAKVFLQPFLVLIFLNIATAQDCDTLFQEAYTAYERVQWDNAYEKFDIARSCFANKQQWEKYYKCSNGMSFVSNRQRKWERIPQIFIPVLDTLNKYSKDIENYRSLTSGVYRNVGAAYAALENPDRAIQYMSKGLELTDDIGERVTTYMNMGFAYTSKWDYEKSIRYHSKALDILTDTFTLRNKKINIINTFNNLGRAYRRYGLYDDALQHFEEGLQELENLQAKDDRQKLKKQFLISSYHNNIAALYNDWGKYDGALSSLNRLHEIKLSGLHSSYHNNLGRTYIGKKDYRKAINSLNKAMEVEEELHLGKYIDKSKVYLSLGEVHYEQKKWQQALDNFQQALIQAIPAFNDTSWTTNPNMEGVHHVRTLLRTLDFKAETLYKYYQITQNKTHLNAALNTYQTALELVDKIRIEQQHDESVFSLLRTARPIYEGAIKAAYTANHPELVYELMEKSKAVILLTALRDAGAKIATGIPDSLLEQEKELKVEIGYNKRRLNKAQLADNQEKIKKYNSILFEKREQLQKLLSQLETNYPEYYEIKYNTDVADINELKNQLQQNNSTAIEYFMGDSTLYACVIDDENVALHQFEKGANFEATLTDFLFATSNPSTTKSSFIKYTNSAAFLYQNLLKPILPPTENILIIPDGRLNYLPFDALIQHPLTSEYIESRYDTLPYLMHQYNINYAYSASVLLEKKPQKTIQTLKPFLGFAPEFSNGKIAEIRGENLDSLVHNQREVEAIKDIMGGTAHVNKAATIQNFFDHAEEYGILHFATHVIAGDTTQNTGHRIHLNDSILLADHIYNTSLNADLIVLSACETGQGQLIEGEGVMSLARAFRYTGCPSLTASLWSVDDKSTADIMIDFYKNLHAQQTQDQALTNSKRNYFKQLNTYEKAHPFYWASFVHVGDTSAIAMAGNSMQWLWWALGFVVLLGLWRWLR